MPEEERKNTAYHESGHAIVAKCSLKPIRYTRLLSFLGGGSGVTMQLPEGDRYSMDKERLLNTIAVLFGGRIAEEIFMDQMTTGASNDFERATQLARDMVTRYGMSDALGTNGICGNEEKCFLVEVLRKQLTCLSQRCKRLILKYGGLLTSNIR